MKNNEILIINCKKNFVNILAFKKEKKLIQNEQNFIKIFIFFLFLILNIKKNKNKNNLEKIIKMKSFNYLHKCLKNLKKNEKFSIFSVFNFNLNKLKKNPKISVIIPVYNCQNSIELSISSIINQNMKDYEIILINDYSNDNTSIIINKLKNFDNRIKIINNQKNMGTLYSRCIGVLNSKGKYIFALDNDDIFLDEDILETIYNIAEKDFYDIVEFKSFTIPNYNPKISEI